MNTIPKALIGTVAAGAMAMASATPALAGDRGRDGISTGEVIAGAVVLGGIAAVIASASRNDRNYRGDYRGGRYDDRDYRYNYRDNRRGNARDAVELCVRAAERQAQRRTGARAEVYEIRDVDRERGGFEVKGRIAVADNYRGRGYRGDYRRGYSNNGWDEGRFTCDVRRGRVVDIDYRGIRGI